MSFGTFVAIRKVLSNVIELFPMEGRCADSHGASSSALVLARYHSEIMPSRKFEAFIQFFRGLNGTIRRLGKRGTLFSRLDSAASEATRIRDLRLAKQGAHLLASVNAFLIRLLISLSLLFASRVKHEHTYLG